MTSILYNISIHLYGLIIRLAAPFNKSAKAWLTGRNGNIAKLIKWRKSLNHDVVWIHCASHGEYEQGLPLLELIKENEPQINIALTFFSPSGYNAIAKHSIADYVGYIPLDRKSDVKKYIDVLMPSSAIFIKNEWWWHTLKELQNRGIPIHFISSTIRKDHYFIKWKSTFYNQIITNIHSYGTIDQDSMEVLQNTYDMDNLYVSGDLRIDRVLKIAKSERRLASLERIKGKVFVHGSIWLSDIPNIKKLIEFYPEHCHIIYPHKLDDDNILSISKRLNANIHNTSMPVQKSVMVMKTMGELSTAYKYATYAYVGGACGDGVHNVLEPAVHGIPVFTGPRIHKSKEAIELKLMGILQVLDKNKSVGECHDLIPHNYKELSNIYFKKHKGGARKGYNYIFGESLK